MPGLVIVSAALAAVTGLSAGLFALRRRHARQLSRAAAELGLEHDVERDAFEGRRSGRSVGAGSAPLVAALCAELGLRRTDSQGRAIFRVAAALEPPLDLGLKVERRGFFSQQEDVFAHDHDFEHRYATYADEPARARALLGPELRLRLITVAGLWEAWLTDGGVLLEPGRRPSAQELVTLFDAAEAIAAELDARRTEVPLPTQVEEVITTWRRRAGELDLQVSVNPVRARGERLLARIDRTDVSRYEMSVTAAVSPPLALGLAARSTRALGLAVTSARDVTSGDLDFDTVFDVEARDERAFREVFAKELRRCLLDLASAYSVTLDDAGVTVRGPLGDGDCLALMCARSTEVADLLARRRGASAYR